MFRWQTAAGVGLGLLMALAILSGVSDRRAGRPLPSGPILSECDGQVRELVIHFEPAAREIVVPVYRDLLRALENGVTVHVVCPTRGAFDELLAAVGPVPCRLNPIVVNHPVTAWSRDRWVALSPPGRGRATTVLSPRGEAAEEIWPARAGDERVGQDLATALAPAVRARRSNLYFDGGDVLADGENVFVVPRLLPRNLQHTVRDREELLRILAAEFKRRVVLLEQAPDHHAGMFMVSTGRRTMLVGDPGLGRRCARADSAEDGRRCPSLFTNLPGGPDFSPETQRLFDAVAHQCAAAGYRVVRLPVVPARDGRTYLTYANAVIDDLRPRRLVFLPFYRGHEPLNAAARAVWEGLGFEVRPVDCTSAYRHFGSLHCLVNVLRRS